MISASGRAKRFTLHSQGGTAIKAMHEAEMAAIFGIFHDVGARGRVCDRVGAFTPAAA